ncbi:uncharacterized mitochondrial protein AtMg00820-like [Solanum stenotomum]|uniref:uncharacterized mitochondrial protein AtMg00820-like n=1 Tax=Solanum stenotomum TaxID=172797 RepID=UPI0020D1D727|nr:uncharacterized mitochondrial protein AtMg00820-like [Solanum stenotomum]
MDLLAWGDKEAEIEGGGEEKIDIDNAGGEIYGDYIDFHGEIYIFGSNMAAMVVVSWWCSVKKKQLNDMENEALTDPWWKSTIDEEMKSLKKNDTWEFIDCPPGKKTVGCRWVYTVKYKSDDMIERFKARLVAKGYTQTFGINYTETFPPVAKINTV